MMSTRAVDRSGLLSGPFFLSFSPASIGDDIANATTAAEKSSRKRWVVKERLMIASGMKQGVDVWVASDAVSGSCPRCYTQGHEGFCVP